jgi:hypothetical protein
VPAAGDAYILKHIINDWDETRKHNPEKLPPGYDPQCKATVGRNYHSFRQRVPISAKWGPRLTAGAAEDQRRWLAISSPAGSGRKIEFPTKLVRKTCTPSTTNARRQSPLASAGPPLVQRSIAPFTDIRKGEIRWLGKSDIVGQRQFIHALLGIAA